MLKEIYSLFYQTVSSNTVGLTDVLLHVYMDQNSLVRQKRAVVVKLMLNLTEWQSLLCSTRSVNQISLVRKVYHKYRKQTLPLRYLDHLNRRRHDFTQDPSRSQKHRFL